MTICTIDVETTGLSPTLNSIHEIGAVIEVDGIVELEINFKTQPWLLSPINPKSLEISGVTVNELREYPNSFEQLRSFKLAIAKYALQEKIHLSGFRTEGFDIPFLENWFLVHKEPNFWEFFYRGSLDCIVLAAEKFKYRRASFGHFNLKTIAKELGIEFIDSKHHTALYDAQIARLVYKKLQDL